VDGWACLATHTLARKGLKMASLYFSGLFGNFYYVAIVVEDEREI
jgi:hypothetical protein